jgi:oligopeptide transport system substrate-binding protein
MSRKVWLILLLVIGALCALTSLCVGATWLGATLLPKVWPDAVATRTGESTETPRQATDASGTLRLAGEMPPTLDPHLVQDSTSAEYVVHLYSGLVRLDRDLQVVPDLASRWEVSADGRTYRFFLRPEATFADGRAITAEDVIYSLERACSPELGSPVAEAYLGDIVGVAERVAGRAESISGLSAPDASTVSIQIDAPKAYFLAKLTYSTAFVVDRAQVQGADDTWMRNPNGSGPFVLESLDRDKIVLARNERYYGPRPGLERVEYHTGSGLPMTMYENDQLDIVGVPPSELARITDPDNALSGEYRTAPELSVQYLAFNVARPPFDDVLVRQAFARAIDKDKLANLVLNGTATPARAILPPGLPAFDPDYPGLTYDPQAARELLAQSRYAGKMPPIVLAISGTGGYMPADTRAILAMLKENLGVEVTVEQVDWPDFLHDLTLQRDAMYTSGWIADYPDPQNFLDLLFHGASPQNHMGYNNPQVNDLLERARVEQDTAQRQALYRQAEQQIVEEAPWVPLTHGVSYILVKPYVAGYDPGPGLYPWLLDVTLNR